MCKLPCIKTFCPCIFQREVFAAFSFTFSFTRIKRSGPKTTICSDNFRWKLVIKILSTIPQRDENRYSASNYTQQRLLILSVTVYSTSLQQLSTHTLAEHLEQEEMASGIGRK